MGGFERKDWLRGFLAGAAFILLGQGGAAFAASPMPQLRTEHGATQLYVDGKPYAILGGELANSSASSLTYLSKQWAGLDAMHLNTVLAPVYWELIEPKEGAFDFKSVDGLIDQARHHDKHLVLLWFGSWKNSMSSYVPHWVKADDVRFPRAERSGGSGMEILSPSSRNNVEADATAFAALMKHLRAYDGERHTVIMIQVENEIGMIPQARDHSPAANAAFGAPVPAQLTGYLAAHKDFLTPQMHKAWASHGFKTGADWQDTFGAGVWTDEMFDAWEQARYAGEVAARGKAIYPLPMYVNAALVRPGYLPGRYVSGGPLPHLFDIWRAAAPAIDILSPDIYFPNFVEWTTKYAVPGNPLFIPETGVGGPVESAANALYAFGQKGLIGFSPFAIERLKGEQAGVMADLYTTLGELMPYILANQGTGKILGLRPPATYDGVFDTVPQHLSIGDYSLTVSFPKLRRFDPKCDDICAMRLKPEGRGALIVQIGPNEFLAAGSGVNIAFGPKQGGGQVGLDSVWEGRFVKGVWTPGRLLNGDDTGEGREVHLPWDRLDIQRIRLYRYH